MLSYLAHHPATAQRIARKLAVKFVRDDPPQALVDRLAQVYLDNGTAIRPVLRALVASAEFQASDGLKVRTPVEDVVATYRALGITMTRSRPGAAAPPTPCSGSAARSAPTRWAGPAPTACRWSTRPGPRPPG